MTTTAELLLTYDQLRERSKQTQIGMSEIGGCRRRAGYIITRTPPSNIGASVQAVMGTAIHDAVTRAFQHLQETGAIPPEDLIDHEVTYAGVLGHLDRYNAEDMEVIDTKTTSTRWFKHIQIHGPDRSNLWQVNLYAAGLIAAGHPVRTTTLEYLARDTGEEHRWSAPVNTTHIRDALTWLTMIRDTQVEHLNRDYPPDSGFCGHCPFQRTCWGEHIAGRDPRVVLYQETPDGALWASRLHKARLAKKAATDAETEAKAALSAIRPVDDTPVDVGWEHLLRWRTISSVRGDSVRLEIVPRDETDAMIVVPTGGEGERSHATDRAS